MIDVSAWPFQGDQWATRGASRLLLVLGIFAYEFMLRPLIIKFYDWLMVRSIRKHKHQGIT